MEDLLESIQASEEELKTSLEAIHACQIDGKQGHFLIKTTHVVVVQVVFAAKPQIGATLLSK